MSHLAWAYAGVAVSGTFLGRDTADGLAYIRTHGGQIRVTQPADLRGQLSGVPPGTAITITYMGQQGGRKVFRVTTP